jgi:2-deoxy-D-gluconate 3-dehydrogenase
LHTVAYFVALGVIHVLAPGSYTAAKGGVAQLTKALANEWAAKGINVNAIAPGYMETDNTSALRDDPVRSRQILDRIPSGPWGQPNDLAGAVVFLCSQSADYIHGHVLVVDEDGLRDKFSFLLELSPI